MFIYTERNLIKEIFKNYNIKASSNFLSTNEMAIDSFNIFDRKYKKGTIIYTLNPSLYQYKYSIKNGYDYLYILDFINLLDGNSTDLDYTNEILEDAFKFNMSLKKIDFLLSYICGSTRKELEDDFEITEFAVKQRFYRLYKELKIDSMHDLTRVLIINRIISAEDIFLKSRGYELKHWLKILKGV